MAQFGVLRDFRFSETDADDIRGAKVYGRDDEKLGKVDDVVFEHSTGNIHYAVVDTGGWLSSKKFLVPADRLRASMKHDGDYEVSLNKDQIESFRHTTRVLSNLMASGKNTRTATGRHGKMIRYNTGREPTAISHQQQTRYPLRADRHTLLRASR